jgi:hypothetical protein
MIQPISLYCSPISPFIKKITRLENKVYAIIDCPKQKTFVQKVKQRTVMEVFNIKKNEPTINLPCGTVPK